MYESRNSTRTAAQDCGCFMVNMHPCAHTINQCPSRFDGGRINSSLAFHSLSVLCKKALTASSSVPGHWTHKSLKVDCQSMSGAFRLLGLSGTWDPDAVFEWVELPLNTLHSFEIYGQKVIEFFFGRVLHVITSLKLKLRGVHSDTELLGSMKVCVEEICRAYKNWKRYVVIEKSICS